MPSQCVFPILEEPARPARSVVIPELVERLLEEVGFVQPPVDLEQQLQCLLPLEGQVLPPGEEVVPLPLDKTAPVPREPRVLPPPHLIHGLPQVLEDVELVVDDPGLRSMPFLEGRLAECLPHVHYGQTNLAAFLGAE